MPITPAIYDALGRIRKVAMIGKEIYSNPDDKPDSLRRMVSPILPQPDHKQILDDKHLLVFLDIVYDHIREGRYNDKWNKLDISLLAAPPDKGANYKWLQDMLVFAPDPEDGHQIKPMTPLVSVNQAPHSLPDWIMTYLTHEFELPAPSNSLNGKKCPGGNVQRGKHNNKDYLLAGNNDPAICDLSEAELSRRLGVSVEDIHFAPVVCSPFYRYNFFFHLDLYAAIVGPSEAKPQTEYLLGAYAIGAREISNFSNALNTAIATIPAKFSFIEVIPVPYVFLQGNGGLLHYPLCNCIVENYTDSNKKHIINVYFPEFSKLLDRDYNDILNIADKNKQEECINAYIASLYDAINQLDVSIAELPIPGFDKEMLYSNYSALESISMKEPWIVNALTALKESIRQRVQQNLKNYCNGNAFFIEYDFERIANEKKAGLHCLMKVIERDHY